MSPAARAARIVLAAIPLVMLTVFIPIVNHIQPRVWGIPFLLVWITLWVLVSPLFLFGVSKLEQR